MTFKKEQLFERVLNFGVCIIGIANKLPKTPAGYKIGSQLVGSATSIGANTQEAQDASSRRDFINKMGIALREARETKYWLTLIEKSGLLEENELGNELKESDELCAIYSTIVKRAKSNLSNLKSQISNVKGFTLIELLVVIGILSIIAGVSSNILLSVTRSNNKSNVINEVQQNGNFILQTLESSLRNARSITYPDAALLGTSVTRLTYIDKNNQTLSYRINANQVQKQTGSYNPSGTWLDITNSNARSGVSVGGGSGFTLLSSAPQSLKIVVVLSQGIGAPGRIDYQASTTFQTTVSLRDY